MQADTICLDERYSTTTHLTSQKPTIQSGKDDKYEQLLFLPTQKDRKGEGGLRTKGYFKKSLPKKPLVSIITVVYNGEKFLEETILSVLNQSYENVEYIIIDGGSTDGTLEIIKKYTDAIDYWVSEGDEGIYYAMNKGIEIVTGEWVNFMNAGDLLLPRILNKIFYDKVYECSIIYGNNLAKYSTFTIKQERKEIKKIWKGMRFCHQASFVKNTLHKRFKFDTKFKLAADYDFFYRVYEKGKIFKYVPSTVCLYNYTTGYTKNNSVETYIEYKKIVGMNSNCILKSIFYNLCICKVFLFQNLKNILGTKMTNCILKTFK